MSENDKYDQFLPENEFEREQMVYEVRPDAEPHYQERIPSGYDPMGKIQLDGKAYRSLAGGRIAWWVLMTGWVIFGGLTFAVLIPTAIALITSKFSLASLMLLLPLLINFVFLIILWKGTNAKLSVQKNQSRKH